MDCSEYFYHKDNTDSLHERLKISEIIMKKGILKKDEIQEFLRVELKEVFKCDVRFWLQGSYKSRTLIKPVSKFSSYDIDLGVYIFLDSDSISASVVKSALREALENFCKINDECDLQESKNACEGLKYTGFLTIDTPIYAVLGKSIKLATDVGWVDSDPRSIQEHLTHVFKEPSERALMKRVVRYFKSWINVKWCGSSAKKIPSIAINVLVANHLAIRCEDDETFINTAMSICDELSGLLRVENPIDGSDLLAFDDEDEEFAYRRLDDLRAVCERCIESPQYKLILLPAIFEHYFPLVKDTQSSEIKNLPSITSCPCISVNRYSKDGQHLTSTTASEVDAIKGDSLTFSIANKEDFSPDVLVHWTVRNIGTQANDANDIGHKISLGLSENTKRDVAYTGKHSIEAVVVLDGVVKGIGFVEITAKPNHSIIVKRQTYKGPRR